MSDVFWATYALLWVLVALLTIMVVLLYRQFGLMWMRGSRRIGLAGLDVGSTAPHLELEQPDGRGVQVTWNMDSKLGSFVLFTLPTCPICKSLAETTRDLPRQWPDVEFLWVDSEAPSAMLTAGSERGPGWHVGLSPNEAAHLVMDVPAVPYAYVIRPGGTVSSKGLVNSLEDIDALLTSSLSEHGTQDGLFVGRTRGEGSRL